MPKQCCKWKILIIVLVLVAIAGGVYWTKYMSEPKETTVLDAIGAYLYLEIEEQLPSGYSVENLGKFCFEPAQFAEVNDGQIFCFENGEEFYEAVLCEEKSADCHGVAKIFFKDLEENEPVMKDSPCFVENECVFNDATFVQLGDFS